MTRVLDADGVEVPQTAELPHTDEVPQTAEFPHTDELPQTEELPQTAELPHTADVALVAVEPTAEVRMDAALDVREITAFGPTVELPHVLAGLKGPPAELTNQVVEKLNAMP